MIRVSGIDGCKNGWVVASGLCTANGFAEFTLAFMETIEEAMQRNANCIGIDMPIGLLDKAQKGGREADRLARKIPTGRSSAIFSPP